MIKKVAHLADIHLRKSPTRNEEYIYVFDELIKSLKKEKPDRIVIVGDIVNDYLALGTEQMILARNFLLELSLISPVIITRGNHDCLKINLKRKDSIEAIISGLSTDKIIYYSETGFYEDDNVIWVVWHHGSKVINPWKTKEGKTYLKNKPEGKTTIDLFHDKISNSMTPTGYEITGDELFSSVDFKGDYSLLGDIHLKQYLNKEKTKAYSGSLIAQDFGEGDDQFHGYLLWDIIGGSTKEIEVKNMFHKYINVYNNENTDFDDLNYRLDSNIKNISLRVVWETLPATRNKENEQKIKTYVGNQHNNVRIFHKNKFISSDNIEITQTEVIKNILNQEVQQDVFKDYLSKIGVSNDHISDIIKLDNEVQKHLTEEDSGGYEWDVVKFGATNFMSYEKFEVDWREKIGLFQITGKNTAGKTTLAFKFIPFMLFGKTLETETRMKHGDIRFINNRSGAESTEGYLILDVNGQYYGIKKVTKIQRNKENEITGVPTKITYHELSSSEEELTDSNNIDSLDENRKDSIQKIITSVVGSYDNFMRVVLTTSDTLNRVLSSDMSEFLDSLLFDSGLDVFDKKLSIVKKIEKKINEKGRISCDVDEKNSKIEEYSIAIENVKKEINKIETVKLKELKTTIENKKNKIDDLNSGLYLINDEIYNLNVEKTKRSIETNEKYIKENEETIKALIEANQELPDEYDESRFAFLEERKSKHKEIELNLKIKIRDFRGDIEKHKHSIEIVRGQILNLENSGKELKERVKKLKESKVCPECGQELTEEHKEHITKNIKELVDNMYSLKDEIENKKKIDIPNYEKKIKQIEINISKTEDEIEDLNNKMEEFLVEFGELINKKNDVEKKSKNLGTVNLLTIENENLELKNGGFNKQLKEYNDSLIKIQKNRDINEEIKVLKSELSDIEEEKTNYQNSIYERKLEINNLENKIEEMKKTVQQFKKQERRDEIFSYYKKCVHRDGIPKQMLVNHIVPKINSFISELLSETPFMVWLDETTLRPKIKYNERPNSIIDCIGASGKERTYSSIVLKFALNQINVKSKPKMFMMDEIMGKLDDNSVEEFVQIMHTIKRYMNRVLVVEHSHNVLPDYLIDVTLNENGLSEALLIDN